MFAVATGSTHPVTRVVFHPNGETFAAGQPNFGVSLLARAGGQVTGTIQIPRVADHTSIVFCDDGARLAVGSLRGVHLFDVATGNLVWHAGGEAVRGAVVAGQGEKLITAARFGLREIRLSTGVANSLRAGSRPLLSRATVVALSPCGRWGFGVYARVRPSLIDLTTGRVACAVDHPCRDGNAPAVTFSTGGERFAVCDGNDVVVYDTPAAAEPEPDDEDETSLVQPEEKQAPRPREVLKPAFRLGPPAGRVVTPQSRGRLRFVNEDEPPAGNWRPPVAFTPGGRGLLVRRPRNRVQLWDVATGAHAGEWSWRFDGMTSLAVAPDGLTAVAGARFGRVVVWDLE